jgi:carbamoyl-phosphate synthase small subunit
MDLAAEVSCRQTYTWDETRWVLGKGYGKLTDPKFHVVAIDYGIKRNILRSLATAGCKVTVVPANSTAEDVLRHNPDGVFFPTALAIRLRLANMRCRPSRLWSIAASRSSASASVTRCWRSRLAARPARWSAAIAAPIIR